MRLERGDTLIQGGTSHAWHNPSVETRCVFAVLMIEAPPIRIGERTLEQTPIFAMMLSSLRPMIAKPLYEAPVQRPRPSLGNVRRIVTGHDAPGRAAIRGLARGASRRTLRAAVQRERDAHLVPEDRQRIGAYVAGKRVDEKEAAAALAHDVVGQTAMNVNLVSGIL